MKGYSGRKARYPGSAPFCVCVHCSQTIVRMRYLLPFLLFGCLPALAQEMPLLHNAYLRPATSLDGDWRYLVDRYEMFYYNFWREPYDSIDGPPGRDAAFLDERPKDKSDRLEYGFDEAGSLAVPGDWNSQKDELYYYEGSVMYRRRFDDPRENAADRLLLYFGAANYRADVYVNGQKVGTHFGGFTPFNFDVTDYVKRADNSLVVRVDNRRDPAAVPTDVTDWWNYGGLTRSVKLIAVPPTYVGDYMLQLDPVQPDFLVGYVQLRGPARAGQTVALESPELQLTYSAITDETGRVPFRIRLGDIRRWSTDDPYRYTFTVRTAADRVTDRIGLRTITTRGSEILLNGEPIFLRGICAHDENPIKGGRANTPDDARLLLGWAKEMNANFMRLAHYPHQEHLPRLAEEMGMLLWEEIPVYWTIHWEDPATYALAATQLTELIARDKNRASVIIWSVANETPNSDARLAFLRGLIEQTRALDPTRLVSAALFKDKIGPNKYTITDPLADYTDLVSFNEYLGWYEGLPDILDKADWIFRQNKPVIVSEFGAGAKGGFRADSLTRWSEEYQDWLYRETLEMLDRMPQLAGFTPWILADFRSPRRFLPRIQDGWNRKGVISQHGRRKLAFKTMRAYYARKAEEK